MNEKILIRELIQDDCETIAEAFAAQRWDKPRAQYEKYLREQRAGKRAVLIALFENEFAGYVTIVPQSDFAPFREKAIPEIVDLNVLLKFRERGIGSALMETAENLIAAAHETIGVRVGSTADYGAAQRMYFKRGYAPDGLGISQNGIFPRCGDKIIVDDDLTLSLTKKLK